MAAGNICNNGAHLPYGEAGLGTYGAHQVPSCDKYGVLLKSDFLQLAKNVPFRDNTSAYNIGDYGSSDGAGSMTLIRKLITILKEHHGSDVPFQVIYEDQEVNDFNSLFRRLSGLIPDPPSYLLDFENVFALASGTNFYKQCVPADSMHIIISLSAAHYLSGKPPVSKDSIYSFPDTDTDVRHMLEKQSSADWEKFLILRGRELKKGGLLAVSVTSNYTTRTGETMCSGKSFLSILNTVWTTFRDMGKISHSEFVNTNVASCDRSLMMLKAPFEDPDSKVRECNLRLLKAELVTVPCRVHEAWRQKKEEEGVDDRARFARRLVLAHRCWTNSAFMTGLSGGRSNDEKELIVEELYGKAEEMIRNMNPDYFKENNLFAYLYIIKD